MTGGQGGGLLLPLLSFSFFLDENGFQNLKFSVIPVIGSLFLSMLLERNREFPRSLGSIVTM